jgi:hypothetical protein
LRAPAIGVHAYRPIFCAADNYCVNPAAATVIFVGANVIVVDVIRFPFSLPGVTMAAFPSILIV